MTRARIGGATRSIPIRLGPVELAEVDAAADADGLGRATWIRAAIVLALRDTARRQQIRDAAALVLLAPPR